MGEQAFLVDQFCLNVEEQSRKFSVMHPLTVIPEESVPASLLLLQLNNTEPEEC